MSAKLMHLINMTSSFSNLEKMRCKPLSLRNSRWISLRHLYGGRVYSHTVTWFCLYGITGIKPRPNARCRIPSPSYARSVNTCTGHRAQPSLGRNLRPSIES